jgi:CRP-like cAMP-binding protein
MAGGVNFDYTKLKDILPFITDVDPIEAVHFLSKASFVTLKKGEIFLEPGSQTCNIYYIRSGLIRSFMLDSRGEEITNRIRYENQVMSCLEMDLLKEPSRYFLQALEPTELLVMELETMRALIDKHPRLEPARRYFVNNALIDALSALDNFILLSPEERYIKFIDDHPQLLHRIPNKLIANLLGITPVSLSRIRKRIAKRRQ